MQPGETLWRIAHAFGLEAEQLAGANRITDVSELAVGTRLYVPLAPETGRFSWPVRGTVQPTTRARRLAIRAHPGTLVRAARSGIVAAAVQSVNGLGRTIIVDHGDGYLTVYGQLEQMLVSPGATVRHGIPIGLSGAHEMQFEIRFGTTLVDPRPLLPDL